MSEVERPTADTPGTFVQVVRDGRKLADVAWTSGRLVLSNRRLVLASPDGKHTITLSRIGGLKLREDLGESAGHVPAYVSCQVGADVFLLGPAEYEPFLDALFGAILDQQTVLVKHPVVKGGVVRDTDWVSGKMTVESDTISLALSNGRFVEVEVDDVGAVAESTTDVDGEQRRVLEIEHGENGESVETHVSGSTQATSVLGTYARRGESSDVVDVDLSDAERAVLMALYTGVSPFEIPDFVGLNVERVEEIYEGLVASALLEAVGTRREVELEARGRSIASEAMTEQ